MVATRAAQSPIPYECTYCKKRPIDAKATTPFVRGLIIWFRLGEKVALGCVGCVRLAVWRETGLSLLVGWFSPFALIINPFMLLYGASLALFLGQSPVAARKYLQDRGFPTGDEGDLRRASYALAIQMLVGEWTKEAQGMSEREAILAKQESLSPARIAVVSTIGRQLVHGFETSELEWYAIASAELGHPLHIAQAAKRILPTEQCETLNAYLGEISRSIDFTNPRRGSFEAIQKALI